MSTSDTATYSSSASRIGDWFSRIRTERGMSRAELGEKIGLDQHRVQQYENGRRKPKAPLLEKIALVRCLHCLNLKRILLQQLQKVPTTIPSRSRLTHKANCIIILRDGFWNMIRFRPSSTQLPLMMKWQNL